MITCLKTRLNHYYDLKGKRLPILMSLILQFAICNEFLHSVFVLPNLQIFFVQKISFATFGVSIDDFFYEIRWSGLQPIPCYIENRLQLSESSSLFEKIS